MLRNAGDNARTASVVDWQIFFRLGLTHWLTEVEGGWRCVADDGAAGIVSQLGDESPDLIFLATDWPGYDGMSVLRHACARATASPIIALGDMPARPSSDSALANGAHAYLPRHTDSDTTRTMIEAVLAGSTYATDCAARNAGAIASHNALTARQTRVLNLMTHGLSNKEIARLMDVDEVTVKTHVTAIFRKLGVGNRTRAVIKAIEYGLADSGA